ncbi:class I adenylate-forming enzyme family protein [Streptosporangium longisporum]|uniref:class I adenylate-forming enzyme family protein n=1 Tax=Streptosporangium longisporum TaxID=46187 RepID=UPI0031E6E506
MNSLGVARELERHGLAPGDRVVLKADNSAGYVHTLLALAHCDASIVLLDHRLTGAETRRVIDQCDVRWVIADGPDEEDPAGAPRFLLIEDLTDPVPPSPDAGTGTGPDLSRWRRRTDALIAWSTGSTKEPKAIVKSGGAFLTNLERTLAHMGYRDDDVLLPLLPFSHQYGLSLVFLAHLAGASLLVTPYRRIDLSLAAAAAHGATVVDATPATYRSLLNLAERNPRLLECLRDVRLWCTGGAPLDGSLSRRFASVMGAPLLDGYGSTELGNVSFATPDNPSGCGRTLDGIEVRVAGETGPQNTGGTGVLGGPGGPGGIDLDAAGTADDGFGEIWVRSPDVMVGYLDPDGRIQEQTGEWYRTGDLGYLSDTGDLYVIGRSQAVHRMGHLIYPEALAAKAGACGRQVVVVPVDDERWGSRLVFVVVDPDGGDPQEWKRTFCSMLPSFEHPNQVVVVSDLPLNRNGKVDVKQLRLQNEHPVTVGDLARSGARL